MKLTKLGLADKRFKNWEVREANFWKLYGNYISVALLGALVGASLMTYYVNAHKTSPKTIGQTIIPKVEVVKAVETPCTYDPLTYLRCRGRQLGINDYEITKIIQVMKCESGLRPDAINKNKNGTFDIGIGQINDVHSKRISRQDRMDFVKNIDFVYKLYQEQNLRPWVCAHKLGLI